MTIYTFAAKCHTCDTTLTTANHADESPVRYYCDKCSGCSRVELDDRCDSCYAVGLAELEASSEPSNVTDILGESDAGDVRAAAAEYYEGLGSALYALSSTGTLTEWLPREAREALKLAEEQADWGSYQAFEILLAALNMTAQG